MLKNATNRRSFLRSAGATAATFTILKAGSARTYAANETLNIASIGAGGQAASDIQAVASQNIVALCDVDHDRAAGMFDTFPKAKQFKDYADYIENHQYEEYEYILRAVAGLPVWFVGGHNEPYVHLADALAEHLRESAEAETLTA